MTVFALPPRKTECPDCGRTKVAAASITTMSASLFCLACGSVFEVPSRGSDDVLIEDWGVAESAVEPTASRSRIRPSAWSRANLAPATTIAIALSSSPQSSSWAEAEPAATASASRRA